MSQAFLLAVSPQSSHKGHHTFSKSILVCNLQQARKNKLPTQHSLSWQIKLLHTISFRLRCLTWYIDHTNSGLSAAEKCHTVANWPALSMWARQWSICQKLLSLMHSEYIDWIKSMQGPLFADQSAASWSKTPAIPCLKVNQTIKTQTLLRSVHRRSLPLTKLATMLQQNSPIL